MHLNSKTKKILSGLVALNLLLGALYVCAFLYIKSTNEQISDLTEQVNHYEKRSSLLESLKDTIKQSQPKIDALQSYFIAPGPDGTVAFINTLESAGSKDGLEIVIDNLNTDNGVINTKDAAATKDTTKKTDYKEILNFKVHTSGTWDNTFSFLSYLENLPYKITVGQVDMTKVAEKDTTQSSGQKDASAAALGKKSLLWKGEFSFTVVKLK